MRRAFDANLNRTREGLRVLEDVVRFALDDASLTGRLKDLRHQLAGSVAFNASLLSARRSDEDAAAFLNTTSEMERIGLSAIVVANAKRVEESLRVLEEMSKLKEFQAETRSETFKTVRFAMYGLEKDLVDRLTRREKAARVNGLYVIVDRQLARDRSLEEVTAAAIAGGARVIQLRDKGLEKGLLFDTAVRLREMCQAKSVLFIINDHVDLAIAVEADGVHVGQKDLPVSVVRKLVPVGMLVGCSTARLAEAQKAEQDGADYVGVGTMFPTASKENARSAGPSVLHQIKKGIKLPVFGIGGINAVNVTEVMEAGADGVAVISAVISAVDVTAAAREICQRMDLLH